MKLLPLDYALRNLSRRPVRTGLTVLGLALTVLLVLAVGGFVRGLDRMLRTTGRDDVLLIYGAGSADSMERSEVDRSVPALATANIAGIRRTGEVAHVSPEVVLGTLLQVGSTEADKTMGLVRGVTAAAYLVHPQVYLAEGDLPQAGQVMVGRLAAVKLGVTDAELRPGATVYLDGRPMRVSGRFVAGGTAMEAELWTPLEDLMLRIRRDRLSLVAVQLGPEGTSAEVRSFCKRQQHLEIEAMRETEYYADLAASYRPVQYLCLLMAAMIAVGGLFCGMNTLYAAVAGRARELAALQAVGFSRTAVAVSLIQESLLLSAAAALPAAAVGLLVLNRTAVRFTMGAFSPEVDEAVLGFGLATAAALGVLGAIPPAIRALRMPIADGLKSA